MTVSAMLNFGSGERTLGTFWRCSRCDTFVSIYSARILGEALCPACGNYAMESWNVYPDDLAAQITDS